MQKNMNKFERGMRIGVGLFLASMAFWGPRKKWYLIFALSLIQGITGRRSVHDGIDSRTSKEKDLADDYFPVQSKAEQATGHPLVGVV